MSAIRIENQIVALYVRMSEIATTMITLTSPKSTAVGKFPGSTATIAGHIVETLLRVSAHACSVFLA